jgi:hypothetical protein
MIDGVALSAWHPLTDTELDAPFADAWPDHRHAGLGPVLQRSLTWIKARSGDRLTRTDAVSTRR